MRRGKVKESILKRSVLKQLHTKSASGSPRYGEDAGMLPLADCVRQDVQLLSAGEKAAGDARTSSLPGEHVSRLSETSSGGGTSIAISVNPVEGWTLAARRTVFGAVNSLAAAGAVPKSIAPVILMPEGTQESQLKRLMREMDALCEAESISMLAGHTAVSPVVKTLVISVMAIGIRMDDPVYAHGAEISDSACVRKKGHPRDDGRINNNGSYITNPAEMIRGGLDVVVAGTVGREGAAMIAIEKEKELTDRFAVSYIEQAKHLFDDGSLRAAAELARAAGAVHIHDVREGGIFAGLWELAAAGKVGLLIDLKKIPIRQHTIEVCEYFRLNPYQLRSGGTMLMLCVNGDRVVSSLTEAGIAAAVIGQTTEGNDRIIRYDDEIRYLEPPKEDEYYKICDVD